MLSNGASTSPIGGVYRRAPTRRRAGGVADTGQAALLRTLGATPPPRFRPQVAVVIAATLVLHLLALWWLGRDVGPGEPRVWSPELRSEVLQVELIETPAVATGPASARQLPDLDVRPPPPRTAVVPGKRTPEPPPVAEAPTTPNPDAATVQLFDRDGRVLLPGAESSGVAPAWQTGVGEGGARPRVADSPVHYEETRFEDSWVPLNESALGAAVRKTTMTATVLPLPGGSKVKCVIAPLALGFGCGVAGPEQLNEPLKVEYTRGNLPSATPLVRTPPAEATPRDPGSTGGG